MWPDGTFLVLFFLFRGQGLRSLGWMIFFWLCLFCSPQTTFLRSVKTQWNTRHDSLLPKTLTEPKPAPDSTESAFILLYQEPASLKQTSALSPGEQSWNDAFRVRVIYLSFFLKALWSFSWNSSNTESLRGQQTWPPFSLFIQTKLWNLTEDLKTISRDSNEALCNSS